MNRTSSNNVVQLRNMNILNGMASKGLIELHHNTGERVTNICGTSVRVYYIQDSKDREFMYNGRVYRVEYREGCFYPSVYFNVLGEWQPFFKNGSFVFALHKKELNFDRIAYMNSEGIYFTELESLRRKIAE